MSLIEFYSALFPGSVATWMIGGTVLLVIIIFVGEADLSLFEKIIWTIVLWLLSPAIYWIFRFIWQWEFS
jgi:hypothetical protein